MRSILLAFLIAAPLAACECATPTQYAAIQPVAAAAPCAPAPAVAAAPCAPAVAVAAAPAYQYAMAAPVGVEMRVGAPEVAKAGLAIPGNVVICAGNFLKCVVNELFPTPTPSARYVYAAPAVQYVQVQAPSAAPCVPFAAPPPVLLAPAPAAAPCR